MQDDPKPSVPEPSADTRAVDEDETLPLVPDIDPDAATAGKIEEKGEPFGDNFA